MIPLEGWPQPFKPLREPIRTLIGRYEAGLARDRNHSTPTLQWFCEAIEGFFYDHPRVSRPEQILITDVEDWKLAKLDAGNAPNSLRRDLCALKAFYHWLAFNEPEYSGLDDPFWVPPPQIKTPEVEAPGVTQLHPSLIPQEE